MNEYQASVDFEETIARAAENRQKIMQAAWRKYWRVVRKAQDTYAAAMKEVKDEH